MSVCLCCHTENIEPIQLRPSEPPTKEQKEEKYTEGEKDEYTVTL